MNAAIIQLLTVLGGLSGIAAIINAVLSRRKVGADAASVLTQAASGLVADLQKQIDAMKTQLREQSALLAEHRVWDKAVARQLRDAGLPVPDPPPLSPND